MSLEHPLRVALEHPHRSGPKPRRQRRARRPRASLFSFDALREVVLWIGAVVGTACILASLAAVAFDVKPVIFRSGSMSPSIETGALAFSRSTDAADLAIGDVVTVPSGTGERITHRIEQVTVVNGQANLILRGDANDVADDRVYVVESAPRVLFDVPKAGYVVSYATGPIGVFAGGLLVGLVMLTVLRPGSSGPTASGPRTRKGKPGGRRALVVASTLVVGAAASGGVGSVPSTLAYYQDSARATSGVFTGKEAGDSAACSVQDGVVTFRLNPVSGATGYRLRFGLTASTMTTILVGPDGVATIDASHLGVGVYLTSVTVLGVGQGVGVSTSLGAFTVAKVRGVLKVSILLCLDIHLQLGRSAAPPTQGLSGEAPVEDAPAGATEPTEPPEPSAEAEPVPEPESETAPVEEPAPAVDEPPAAEPQATP